MAWTTPRDWTTGEVVTEAMMDVHVKDNLNYLKGAAGAVGFDDELTITASVTRHISLITTGQSARAFFGLSGGAATVWDMNRDPTSSTFTDTAKSHARILLDGNATASNITLNTANAANTLATERMRISGAGDIGIGTNSPQGRLHGYDTISGFLHYKFDGVDGTARTIIPDGTGDVLYGLMGLYQVRKSDGTLFGGLLVGAGGVGIAPGASQDLDSGADALTLAVAANGSVTIQRTGGSSTYKVALWLLWL